MRSRFVSMLRTALTGSALAQGKIDAVTFSPEARVETWIQKGVEVTSLYDPMLAKLIVHGSDRADAIAKMERVLRDSRVYGITSNMQYLAALLKTETYQTGAFIYRNVKRFYATGACNRST